MPGFYGQGGLTTQQTADLALAATALQPDDVGTMATQNATAVEILGGTATNVTITGGTTGASPTKTVGSTYPLTVAGQYQNIGIPVATVNGASASIIFDATGARFEQRSSTTSAGNMAGGINVLAPVLSSDMPFTAYFRVRTAASIANYSAYVGISASQPTYNSATPPTNSLLARFVQGTDTKFTAFGRAAGSASSGAPFGPDVATSTTYMIRVRNVPGTGAYFSAYAGSSIGGNFGTEVLVATVPASGAGLGWVAQGGAFTAGTAVTFAWSLTQLEW
jgi:hypothetical protein